jgi:hypothetical protein
VARLSCVTGHTTFVRKIWVRRPFLFHPSHPTPFQTTATPCNYNTQTSLFDLIYSKSSPFHFTLPQIHGSLVDKLSRTRDYLLRILL